MSTINQVPKMDKCHKLHQGRRLYKPLILLLWSLDFLVFLEELKLKSMNKTKNEKKKKQSQKQNEGLKNTRAHTQLHKDRVYINRPLFFPVLLALRAFIFFLFFRLLKTCKIHYYSASVFFSIQKQKIPKSEKENCSE